MSRTPKLTASAVALIVFGALSGCGSDSQSTSAGEANTGGAASSSGTAVSGAATHNVTTTAATTTAATTTAAATTSPAKAALPASGTCVLIDAAAASKLLGATATGIGSKVTGAGAVKIDGCVYKSGVGNMGYDVNDLSAAAIKAVKAVAVMKAAAASGEDGVKAFNVPGGDASAGFTLPIGAKTMARIEIAVGKYDIALNVVAGKTAQQVALAAAAKLVAAVT